MKNDPLLNKQWNPPSLDEAIEAPAPKIPQRTTGRTSDRIPQSLNRAPRVKHPAISSRILATGFSIAAVIGVSTAYAKAQKQEELQKLIAAQNAANGVASQNGAGVQSQGSPAELAPAIAPNSPSSPQAPATTLAPRQSVTTSPNVVQIPVAPAQPAQPAYTPPTQDRGNQSSGGSR